MSQKKIPGKPPETPSPKIVPGIKHPAVPEEPELPEEEEEDPDIIPDEDPFETPPYEEPPPGEGP